MTIILIEDNDEKVDSLFAHSFACSLAGTMQDPKSPTWGTVFFEMFNRITKLLQVPLWVSICLDDCTANGKKIRYFSHMGVQ